MLDPASVDRIHISLPVSNLSASIAFYTGLFGQPVRLRADYAKFAPEGIPINLSLLHQEGVVRPAGPQHFGVQVASPEAVSEAHQRLKNSGYATREETGVVCCYARQDKIWVDDPDGNHWEVFVVTEADLWVRDERADQACCPTTTPEACCADPVAATSCCPTTPTDAR